VAQTHAAFRLAGGFNIDQMVSEYRALRGLGVVKNSLCRIFFVISEWQTIHSVPAAATISGSNSVR
jgi:hypothetical protein